VSRCDSALRVASVYPSRITPLRNRRMTTAQQSESARVHKKRLKSTQLTSVRQLEAWVWFSETLATYLLQPSLYTTPMQSHCDSIGRFGRDCMSTRSCNHNTILLLTEQQVRAPLSYACQPCFEASGTEKRGITACINGFYRL